MNSIFVLRRCSRIPFSYTRPLILSTLNHISSSSNVVQASTIHTFATDSLEKATKFLHEKSKSIKKSEWLDVTNGFTLVFLCMQFMQRGGKKGFGDDGLEISRLGVDDSILKSLAQKGITKLFPIQRTILEPALQGKDMIVKAKMGSGEKLAFGLYILDNITKFKAVHGKGKNPLALVLSPTRELARRVDKEFREISNDVDTLCVYGDVPVSRQTSALDRGVDVVVGTPGRIIDLFIRGALNLSEVQFVVVNEADRMLNVGFAENVETILESIKQDHQTMMFSDTMPAWIVNMADKFLKTPLFLDLVGDDIQESTEGTSLFSVASDASEKLEMLEKLIADYGEVGRVIVLTQTRRDADRLANALEESFKCEALHAYISEDKRERTLSGFRDGRINVLVATAATARSLDVPNVDLAIHFDLPSSSKIFEHWTSRTGRAGKKGTAILMYSPERFRDVKRIEQDTGCKFIALGDACDAKATDGSGDNKGKGNSSGSSNRQGGGNEGVHASGDFGWSGTGDSDGSKELHIDPEGGSGGTLGSGDLDRSVPSGSIGKSATDHSGGSPDSSNSNPLGGVGSSPDGSGSGKSGGFWDWFGGDDGFGDCGGGGGGGGDFSGGGGGSDGGGC